MSSDDQAGIGWSRGASRGGGRRAPGPLAVLMGVNIAVFVLQYGFGLFGEMARDERGQRFFSPDGSLSRETLFGGRVWELVTHMFVHGNLLHIAMNMLGLYFVGRFLLRIVDNKTFLKIYFVSGLAGATLHLLLVPNPMVGASACVFGLIGALGAIMPEQRINMLLFFVLPIRLRMGKLVQGLAIASAVLMLLGMLTTVGGSAPAIGRMAHGAHLGGLLGGWLFARLSGLAGPTLTRSKMLQLREKNDRKLRKRRGSDGSRGAKVVSIRTGEPLPAAGGEGKDPLRAEMDEILDRMNREGRGKPTETERKVLEENARKLAERSKTRADG